MRNLCGISGGILGVNPERVPEGFKCEIPGGNLLKFSGKFLVEYLEEFLLTFLGNFLVEILKDFNGFSGVSGEFKGVPRCIRNITN